MRYTPWLALAVCMTVGTPITSSADEGMWPLYSINQLPLEQLQKRGLRLTPEQIYNPEGACLADAAVQVGGASGSFVSADGLILTNHHVAFGAVQEQSTVEHNYVRDGFYAATRDKEIPAIGYKVYVTLSAQDVTRQILSGVGHGMADLKRYQVIDKNIKKLIRDTEKGREIKARVASMFGGKQYVLYTTLELRDIRIVYVPPDAIGDFGGDIDNWMWPRHAGDFAFLRAYVAPDGKPADFAEGNVPYKPEVFLPIATDGVRDGDLAMTIGFPGGTSRHISSYELAHYSEFYYPNSIRVNEDQIEILNQAGQKDSAIGLRLSRDLKGLNNVLKKSYAIVEGFAKGGTLEQKRETERALAEFLRQNHNLMTRYGHVFSSLDSLYRAEERTRLHDFVLGRMTRQCDYLSLATTIYRWACEREKSDLERDRGYQNRDTLTAKERLKNAQINLVPEVDKEILKYFLAEARRLPQEQQISGLGRFAAEGVGESSPAAELVEQWYRSTRIGIAADRLAMFAMSRGQLEKLDDPFINLARDLKPEADDMRERDKAFSGAQTRLTPLLIQAMAEWRQAEMYPDANGTMRLSYGEVKGYSPRDAIDYFYLTGLHGVIDKESGADPFIVPDSLKTAFEQRDFGPWVDSLLGDVPVNFLTTNDITGGNSGSPVINGEGKLIGVAFDGNWEGVASDYLFNPPVTRTISVDIRYIMFVIDRVYHLESLVRELNLDPTGMSFHVQEASR
ncbi:MAG: S46 family peptidase [Candidatus Zixiibacteriota bacterium]